MPCSAQHTGRRLGVPGLTFTVFQESCKLLQIHRRFECDIRLCDLFCKTLYCRGFLTITLCQNGESRHCWHLEVFAPSSYGTEVIEFVVTFFWQWWRHFIEEIAVQSAPGSCSSDWLRSFSTFHWEQCPSDPIWRALESDAARVHWSCPCVSVWHQWQAPVLQVCIISITSHVTNLEMQNKGIFLDFAYSLANTLSHK